MATKRKTENTKQQAESQYWTAMKTIADKCSHRRSNETSVIAWAVQSDGITRGVCGRCATVFSPNRAECVSDSVWSQYQELRKVSYTQGYSEFPKTDHVINGVPYQQANPDWRQKLLGYLTRILYFWTDRHVAGNVKYMGKTNTRALRSFLTRKDSPQIIRLSLRRLKQIIGPQPEHFE